MGFNSGFKGLIIGTYNWSTQSGQIKYHETKPNTQLHISNSDKRCHV